MAKEPNLNSESAKELKKAEEQFDKFEQELQQMTLDRMNMAPKLETEPQNKIANRDLDKMQDIYLKPIRTIGCQDKFNENYREQYEYDKVYVQFQAQNNEIVGETIDIWTRPYAGMPAEEWKVPVNKPVWGPRYLAEQIKRASYHRLTMNNSASTGADGAAQYYGTVAVDSVIQRLDAIPVTGNRSVFMGARNF